MQQNFYKKYSKVIIIILSIICLLSTPIATILANNHITTNEIHICFISSYAQSIRVLCVVGIAIVFLKRYWEEK